MNTSLAESRSREFQAVTNEHYCKAEEFDQQLSKLAEIS